MQDLPTPNAAQTALPPPSSAPLLTQSQIPVAAAAAAADADVVADVAAPAILSETVAVPSKHEQPRQSAGALLDHEATRLLTRLTQQWTDVQHRDPRELAMLYRDRAIALLLINHGFTMEEVCALNEDDYVATRGAYGVLIVGQMRREIAMNLETSQSLSRWLTLRLLAFHVKRLGPLFVTRQLDRVSTTVIKRVIDRLKHESQIDLNTTMLRHSFIMHRVSEGMNQSEIAQLLGRPSRRIVAALVRAHKRSLLAAANARKA